MSSALLPSGIPVNAFFPPVGKGCFFLMPTIPGADIPLVSGWEEGLCGCFDLQLALRERLLFARLTIGLEWMLSAAKVLLKNATY